MVAELNDIGRDHVESEILRLDLPWSLEEVVEIVEGTPDFGHVLDEGSIKVALPDDYGEIEIDVEMVELSPLKENPEPRFKGSFPYYFQGELDDEGPW